MKNSTETIVWSLRDRLSKFSNFLSSLFSLLLIPVSLLLPNWAISLASKFSSIALKTFNHLRLAGLKDTARLPREPCRFIIFRIWSRIDTVISMQTIKNALTLPNHLARNPAYESPTVGGYGFFSTLSSSIPDRRKQKSPQVIPLRDEGLRGFSSVGLNRLEFCPISQLRSVYNNFWKSKLFF